MNQLNTQAIILARTNYGEADRIITLLTPDYGKLRLIAKGVRRVKSKLAGGIELFSISDITFIKGKGDIGTLVSARLSIHYAAIVKDIDRTMLGYELTKQLNKLTEDECESAYFDLLQQAFSALDDNSISLKLIQLWFSAQLLGIAGHAPNLLTDPLGIKLQVDKTYTFDFDSMAFHVDSSGKITTSSIKFLRLVFANSTPKKLNLVQDITEQVTTLVPLLNMLHTQYATE